MFTTLPHAFQALLLYLAASEMGNELAQSNAAWMLERGYGHAGWNAAVVAMSLHRRSAEQGSVQSLLLLGDGYYYGSGAEQDWVRGGNWRGVFVIDFLKIDENRLERQSKQGRHNAVC